METNQTAARNARRFLTDRVRTDWDWPDVPEAWSASDEEVRGVSEFRERYYGTTESDSEKDPKPESSGAANPYKFDTPDSVAKSVELKAKERSRRRRAVQDEEAAWNEGLREFVERRDAWTGAAAVRKVGIAQGKGKKAVEPGETAVPAPESSSTSNDPADPLIPVALPLLPDNPIRASIKPSAYTDIYNNIVVTGRTPSVPVNLSDMTRALVEGWKQNGEWPPKQGPLDPLAGRKRATLAGTRLDHGDGPFLSHHPHVRRGVDSVKRILHLNSHHENGNS